MTDIVIPLIRSTCDNHRELRYALRSMQANLIGIGKLILVGYKPNWCNADIHIPHADTQRKEFKEHNIAQKLLAAPVEQFLYCNDDHFILRRYRASKFPNYYSTTFGGSGNYIKTIENTRAKLGEVNNYDVHCPILINKNRLAEAIPLQWPPFGYCVKTLYAHDLKGKECVDTKIIHPDRFDLTGCDWFSTNDGIMKGRLLKTVAKLFPNKSRWER